MTDPIENFFHAIETHDPARLREALEAGVDVPAEIRGRAPLAWLISMYTRSPRFAACLRVLLERGARIEDSALAAVLLDEAPALRDALQRDPDALHRRHDLDGSFTPLLGATLLHIAAEYQHLQALEELLGAGLAVDAPAAIDADGLGGQTALFHTVNSNVDQAAAVRRRLLVAGARVDVRIAGLIWGRGFEWETPFFDLTPIAYAQLGGLPQMHRDEVQTAGIVRELLAAAQRPVPAWDNLPNRYLRPSH